MNGYETIDQIMQQLRYIFDGQTAKEVLEAYGSWVIKGKCLRGLRPRSTTCILSFYPVQYLERSRLFFPLGGSFAILRQISSACLGLAVFGFSMLRSAVFQSLDFRTFNNFDMSCSLLSSRSRLLGRYR